MKKAGKRLDRFLLKGFAIHCAVLCVARALRMALVGGAGQLCSHPRIRFPRLPLEAGLAPSVYRASHCHSFSTGCKAYIRKHRWSIFLRRSMTTTMTVVHTCRSILKQSIILVNTRQLRDRASCRSCSGRSWTAVLSTLRRSSTSAFRRPRGFGASRELLSGNRVSRSLHAESLKGPFWSSVRHTPCDRSVSLPEAILGTDVLCQAKSLAPVHSELLTAPEAFPKSLGPMPDPG